MIAGNGEVRCAPHCYELTVLKRFFKVDLSSVTWTCEKLLYRSREYILTSPKTRLEYSIPEAMLETGKVQVRVKGGIVYRDLEAPNDDDDNATEIDDDGEDLQQTEVASTKRKADDLLKGFPKKPRTD
ncbi:MAG: hypothetical protein Q9162_002342 [Coniocarpon cinnabarinum]